MTPMHPDDLPSGRGLVPSNVESAIEALGPPSLENPRAVAAWFIQALEDPIEYANALHRLTSRHAQARWGDFAELARWFAEIPNLGYATGVEQPSDDVAYFRLLRDVGDPQRVDGDLLVSGPGIITLIRRPLPSRQWLVFSVGEYVLPEDIPQPHE